MRAPTVLLAFACLIAAWGCGYENLDQVRSSQPPGGPVGPPPPGPSTQVLRAGTFQSANGYVTRGNAEIVSAAGAHSLELLEDFSTSSSGALDVRLCRTPACGGGDLNLGPIRSFSGAQSYALPADAAAFRYAVIWCRAVSLPFGFAELL